MSIIIIFAFPYLPEINKFNYKKIMEEQNFAVEKPKKKYFKFAAVFLAIIVLVGGGYFAWKSYILRSTTQEEEQMMKAYEEYLDIYRKDTYGGKTPQETLNLFVEALKQNDISLAAKYFMPDDTGNRKKWEDALLNANKNELLKAIDLVTRAKPKNTIGDKIAVFETHDNSNNLEAYIELGFNGNVWKIRSL